MAVSNPKYNFTRLFDIPPFHPLNDLLGGDLKISSLIQTSSLQGLGEICQGGFALQTHVVEIFNNFAFFFEITLINKILG